ncbi:MAG: beta-carotene hydroxylase [Vicinamibacterales bacterium]
MSGLAFTAWALAALAGMEGVAYLTHRYLMHGPLWFLHRSHHVPHDGRLEWNDLFGVAFAVPSILLIHWGVQDGSWRLPVGVGMAGYGALYAVFHDVIVHRRVALRGVPQWPYLRRIVRAHLIHHKTHGRDGAVSFGFLYAPPTLPSSADPPSAP